MNDTSNRLFRFSAASVAVFVALGTVVVGCSGSGGGGSGGGGGQQPPGGQTPPPPQSPPVFTSASVSPTTVEGGKDACTASWSGTDAQNDTLSAFVRPAPGAPVQFLPTSPTTTTSFMFQLPAVTVDTSTTVELCLNDGQNALVIQAFSVTVLKPAGGGPVTPPPAPPVITAVDLFNSPILTKTNGQIVEVSCNLTGVTFSGVTATVDGQPARPVRVFGNPAVSSASSFRLQLPRLETPGPKQLAVTFPGRGTSTFTLTYADVGDSWAIFNYNDSTPAHKGRVVKIKTDSLGVASNVSELLAPNVCDTRGLAQGPSRETFWIARQTDNGLIRVSIANASTGAVLSTDYLTGQVDVTTPQPGETSGYLDGVASLRDGSKCVIMWRDVFGTSGQALLCWLSVFDLDPVSGSPRLIKEIPLSQTGKVAAGVLMTPVQTVTLMIDNVIGGGVKQDWAVLGQQTAPFKLFLVPLEAPGVDYFRYDLTVKPQVVECFEDIHQRILQIFPVGQTGSGVRFQGMAVTSSSPLGFGGVDKGITGATQDVDGAYFRNGVGIEVLLGLVLFNGGTYSLFNVAAAPNTQFLSSHSFPGTMNARGSCSSPGNAWFAVYGRDAAGSELHVVQPDFTTIRKETSLNQANTVCATEQDVLLEVRSTDNVIVVGQTGAAAPQVKPESASLAPNGGTDPRRRVASRSLAR